jgi:hypothetical protein
MIVRTARLRRGLHDHDHDHDHGHDHAEDDHQREHAGDQSPVRGAQRDQSANPAVRADGWTGAVSASITVLMDMPATAATGAEGAVLVLCFGIGLALTVMSACWRRSACDTPRATGAASANCARALSVRALMLIVSGYMAARRVWPHGLTLRDRPQRIDEQRFTVSDALVPVIRRAAISRVVTNLNERHGTPARRQACAIANSSMSTTSACCKLSQLSAAVTKLSPVAARTVGGRISALCSANGVTPRSASVRRSCRAESLPISSGHRHGRAMRRRCRS